METSHPWSEYQMVRCQALQRRFLGNRGCLAQCQEWGLSGQLPVTEQCQYSAKELWREYLVVTKLRSDRISDLGIILQGSHQVNGELIT